ncbi:hypothetical protein [Limosilactobacillus ingluviei]|uniref:hypothetical protein n=1 Tax=Limosilactobacillus ingluviei TaxID=148604 RepID=UPI000704EF6E|nr:hypothetical protein [Limosilactobacillus ingluviei]
MPENLAQERADLRAEWQRKTIKDDPIFGTVMTNPTLCAELLWRALPELTIQWVKDADPQHTIQATPTAREFGLTFIRGTTRTGPTQWKRSKTEIVIAQQSISSSCPREAD